MTTEMDSISQNPPDRNRKAVDRESKAGKDEKEEEEDEVEEERLVGSKNTLMTSSGGKVAIWTRSEQNHRNIKTVFFLIFVCQDVRA